MQQAQLVKIDVKFPLSLISLYQLESHKDAANIVLTSQGISTNFVQLVIIFASTLKAEECAPLLGCVGNSEVLAQFILKQPRSTRDELRRILKEKPKELRTFLEPLGVALMLKSLEEQNLLEWSKLVKPMLNLHLAAKLNIIQLVPSPIVEWVKAVNAALQGGPEFQIFTNGVINAANAELRKYHKLDDIRFEIDRLKSEFTYESFLAC